MKKRRKLKKGRIAITTIILLVIISFIIYLCTPKNKELMIKLENLNDVNEISKKDDLKTNITYEYSNVIEENYVIF